MAKALSRKELEDIVKNDVFSKGQYRLVQEQTGMDNKPKARRGSTAFKTRIVAKKATAAKKRTGAPAARDPQAVPDEIVFIESANAGSTDSLPLRKAAVVSGATRRIIGVQG